MSTDLLPRECLPRRQGGFWDYISPSRLSLWARCPLAFKFRYVDGIRSPTTPSLFIGKLCHAGLEVHYRRRQLGVTLPVEDVCGRLTELWENAIEGEGRPFRTIDEAKNARQQTGGLIRAYLDHVPEVESRPLAVETTIEAPLVDPATGQDLGIPLLGIIDVVFDAVPGPIITDFKTAAKTSAPAEVVHEIQLTSYSYLFRRASGQVESELQIRSLVKTKQPKILTHSYSPRGDGHFTRLFSLVREYLDSLDAGRFTYRPNWTCASCDFCGSHCSRWTG